jgi:hypothetical protein
MNLGERAKQILAAIAPTLGTAIGGPFGALAGSLVSSALGSGASDDKAVETALVNATPETLLKLKQSEQDFRAKMAELGISEEKLVYDDVANARAREIAVKDATPAKLAWTIIGGFLAISIAQIISIMGWPELTAKIPGQGWLMIGNISGYLANEAKQCAAYYFGSSLGSKDKDETIASIAKS